MKTKYYQRRSEKKRGEFFVFLSSVSLFLLRAALEAYGGSQARGPIGAVAAGLHHRSQQCTFHIKEPLPEDS